jgi:hypothetical protein
MSKIADATFTGKSGQTYNFGVYTIDTTFKNVGGVYIFSKRTVSDGKGTHSFIYIGETDDLCERIACHEKWPCVERNGANAICTHAEGDGKKRLDIEADLRNGGDTPCNDQ